MYILSEQNSHLDNSKEQILKNSSVNKNIIRYRLSSFDIIEEWQRIIKFFVK